MGVNYYKKRNLTINEKEELIRAIREDRIVSFSYKECKNGYGRLINSDDLKEPLEVHVGKKSWRYRFLFDHNRWKYFHDRKSLVEWLKNGGWLEDEEGSIVEVEDFMQDVSDSQSLSPNSEVERYSHNFERRDGLEFDFDFS